MCFLVFGLEYGRGVNLLAFCWLAAFSGGLSVCRVLLLFFGCFVVGAWPFLVGACVLSALLWDLFVFSVTVHIWLWLLAEASAFAG